MNSKERAKLKHEYQRLRTTKARHRDRLFALPNVNAIGIGYKTVGGKATNRRVISVYVIEKKSLHKLRSDEVIPPDLDGIPTDVIQIGVLRPLADSVYYTRRRPAQGGDSISRADQNTAGTLGLLCVDNTDFTPVILSNSHVLSLRGELNQANAQIGDPIVQPGRTDGGSKPIDTIARLKRWQVFAPPPDWNKVDAAIAEVTDPDDVSPFVHEIGMPTGYRELTIEDVMETIVQKTGKMSGHTSGLVVAINVDTIIEYASGNIYFEDQIFVVDPPGDVFSEGGDSGSAVFDMSNKLVGLLFASSGGITAINQITNVFDQLNISLPTYSKVRVLASDGQYLFAALTGISPRIAKINPTTMEAVATWIAQGSGANVRALTCNGTHLFAALHQNPTLIHKIDVTNMIVKTVWTGESGDYPCYALTLDDSFVYAAMYTAPARVIKIDSRFMTQSKVWTGIGGENHCVALTYDGSYIYVGLDTAPAKVIQVDPDTMETVATWTGAVDQNSLTALFFDGSFVYAGLRTSPAQVVKIRIEEMTTIDTWTGAGRQDKCVALTSDSLSLIAGLGTDPGQVVKIRTSNMSTGAILTTTEEQGVLSAVLFDGLYTFVSLITEPATILRTLLHETSTIIPYVPEAEPLFTIPVLIIRYFPVIGDQIDISVTGDVSGSLASVRQHTIRVTAEVCRAMETGSTYHGYKDPEAQPSLRYEIVGTIEYLESVPITDKIYEGLPVADYNAIMDRVDIQAWVEEEGVREVWLWTYHDDVLGIWESNMAGPYGDISNSDRDETDLPVLNNTYTVYNFNYSRGTSEAVEDHIHQIEALLNHINPLFFVEKFTGPEGAIRCGNAHFPPNAEDDYDWANPTIVETDIENWDPDGLGPIQYMNCSRWNCNGLDWFIYWMQNLPGKDSGITSGGNPLTNWWIFLADWDNSMASGLRLVQY